MDGALFWGRGQGAGRDGGRLGSRGAGLEEGTKRGKRNDVGRGGREVGDGIWRVGIGGEGWGWVFEKEGVLFGGVRESGGGWVVYWSGVMV